LLAAVCASVSGCGSSRRTSTTSVHYAITSPVGVDGIGELSGRSSSCGYRGCQLGPLFAIAQSRHTRVIGRRFVLLALLTKSWELAASENAPIPE
jgi:hypothetical protein